MYSMQGYSLVRAIVFALHGICLLSPYYASADTSSLINTQNTPQLCEAPESYITESKINRGGNEHVERDSSCFVAYPDIASKASSYQLIDSREADNIGASPADVWHLSIAQLKTKSFLKSRPLLILGDGFSRARLSEDCSVLKKSGFEQVKMLIGGMDIWLQTQNKKSRRTINSSSIHSVTAHQVIYEYFNGKVILLAASKEVAAELDARDFKEYFLLDGNSGNDITTIVTTKSNNGMYPVVIIGGDGSQEIDIKHPLPNLYELEGGISALVSQLRKNQLVNSNRSATPRRSFCGKS